MTDIVERLRVRAEEDYEMCNDIHLPLIEAADEIEKLREIIDKQMVKEFADRWANHILYDQPKIPQGFPSLLDALKEKE